jgi:putative colanic acid biosynthesis acetyltransferase WcaF
MGRSCHIYPGAKIWAPWNLFCGYHATVADGATVYNPKLIRLGTHAIISQEAYLCGATHDYEDPGFPLVASEISIGPYAWVCARATVQPGVSLGEGAVLALGSVATRNLDEWSVYAGVPARKIKRRTVRGREGEAAAAGASSTQSAT